MSGTVVAAETGITNARPAIMRASVRQTILLVAFILILLIQIPIAEYTTIYTNEFYHKLF
jgi:hypothetical protein